MSVAVVIVAADRGRRLGSDIPKQYIPLGFKTPLRRVCERFLSYRAVNDIVPVINSEDQALFREALSGLDDQCLLPGTHGGDTRARSVRNVLEQRQRGDE